VADGITVAALIELATSRGFDAHAWWSYEKGLTPEEGRALKNARATADSTPSTAIELALVKAKAIDAYKLGRLASRERALQRLARFCQTIADADIKRELSKTVAAILARDGWPLGVIFDAGTFLGLGRPAAASLAQWAIKKLNHEVTP
jgi:hypothetical protein